MKYKRLFIGVIFLALILPFLSIRTVKAVDTSLSDVISAGKIVVATEAGYAPFEMKNETNDIIGFDPDIMQYIADDIGVDIEWQDIGWAVIFTGLAAGQYDCVISAVTITEEREETMDFTRWYYKSAQAVMVSMTNPKQITNIDDINSTDVIVAFQESTTSNWYVEDNNIVAEQQSFATITLAVQAVKSGAADVVIGDYATLLFSKNADPTSFAIIDTFSPEDFGIACQEGAVALRDRITLVLNELLGNDTDNPEVNTYYNATYTKWMGVPPATEFALDAVPNAPSSGIPGFPIIAIIAAIPIAVSVIIRKMKNK